jgi:RNA:NAD 2'-phosphotransferase (TPT1/KptA family)
MKDFRQFIKTTIREFLNENKTYKLPQYLYHLTSLENFENIKKDGGLKPEFSKQSHDF